MNKWQETVKRIAKQHPGNRLKFYQLLNKNIKK